MVNYNLEYLKSESEKNEIKKYFNNYYRKDPLKVLYVENGIILPRKEADKNLYPNTWMGLGGVLDSSDNFIKMSGIKALYNDDLVFGGKYNYINATEYSEDVLYMGGFEPQWGHFLEEYCTRLWFCLKNEVNCKIAYCGYNCEQNEMPKSFRDFFEFLGIKKEQLFDVRKPIKCKKIIIPEQSFLRYQYYTDDYKDLIDTVYKNGVKCNLTSYEKIYLSRVGFIKKNNPEKERGEWEIQETFRKNGYKILEPETLSLGEQMFYIRHCHILASTLGSVSANAVFASNKIKLIYLRKALSVVPETFQIDQMINAENVTFIDCFFKPYKIFPLAYGAGPHFIGATKEFRKFIKKNSLKLLNSRLYIHAFIKNWFWITNKYRQYNLSKYLDNIMFIKMRKKIRWLIKHEIKNFIIYPFGKFGNIAKCILDEIEDVTYICVDHYKCLENKMIFDINVLEDDRFLNYYILICSDKRSTHYQSVKDTVFQKVREKNRIIEFFS